jgi:hypothetical protein
MKAKNPMRDPEVRAKMSETHKRIGHKPKFQGGNGRGPTEPQQRLAKALGWPMEIAIRTLKKRGSGYPTSYKVDIADGANMIAIEVDGGSHLSLKGQAMDAKKTELLSSLGWTVLRFSNQEVMERLEECVQTVMSTMSKLKERTPIQLMA